MQWWKKWAKCVFGQCLIYFGFGLCLEFLFRCILNMNDQAVPACEMGVETVAWKMYLINWFDFEISSGSKSLRYSLDYFIAWNVHKFLKYKNFSVVLGVSNAQHTLVCEQTLSFVALSKWDCFQLLRCCTSEQWQGKLPFHSMHISLV